MVTLGLTPKQKEVLDFIEEFSKKKGFAPSQQEIAKFFGFKSLGTVQNYLVRLERVGALKKSWNGRRSLEVVPDQQVLSEIPNHHTSNEVSTVSLPLLGKVAAGRPIEALQNHARLEVPRSLFSGLRGFRESEHFALKVSGDSMIDDGILDGDFVVIRSQKSAANGETVVALIGNEATIKRLEAKSDRVLLHAANPKYDPIVVRDREDFKIEGVLVALFRRYH